MSLLPEICGIRVTAVRIFQRLPGSRNYNTYVCVYMHTIMNRGIYFKMSQSSTLRVLYRHFGYPRFSFALPSGLW